MLLIIHNLPIRVEYKEIKDLIISKCGLKDVILDNLQHEGGGMRVTVGVVEEEDAAILVRKINGIYYGGQQLYVEDKRPKKVSEQPYHAATSQQPQYMMGYNYNTPVQASQGMYVQSANYSEYPRQTTVQTVGNAFIPFGGQQPQPLLYSNPGAFNNLNQRMHAPLAQQNVQSSNPYARRSPSPERRAQGAGRREEARGARSDRQRHAAPADSSPWAVEPSRQSNYQNFNTQMKDRPGQFGGFNQDEYEERGSRQNDNKRGYNAHDARSGHSSNQRDMQDSHPSNSRDTRGGHSSDMRDSYSSNIRGGHFSNTRGDTSNIRGGHSSNMRGGHSLSTRDNHSSNIRGGHSSNQRDMGGGYSSSSHDTRGGHISNMRGGHTSNMRGGHTSNNRGGHASSMRGGHTSNMRGGHNSNMRGGHISNMRGGHVPVPYSRGDAGDTQNDDAKFAKKRRWDDQSAQPEPTPAHRDAREPQAKKPALGLEHPSFSWKEHKVCRMKGVGKLIFHVSTNLNMKMTNGPNAVKSALRKVLTNRVNDLMGAELLSPDEIYARYRARYPETEDIIVYNDILKEVAGGGEAKAVNPGYQEKPVSKVNAAPPPLRPVTQFKQKKKALKKSKRPMSPGKIPSYPQGNKKNHSQQKQQTKQELATLQPYQVKADLQKAMEEEVDLIGTILEQGFKNPENNTEKTIYEKVDQEYIIDRCKKLVCYLVSKRITNSGVKMVRVYGRPHPPKRPVLEKFLAPYRCLALKKSVKAPFYTATFDSYDTIDKLCAMDPVAVGDQDIVISFKQMLMAPQKEKFDQKRAKRLRELEVKNLIEESKVNLLDKDWEAVEEEEKKAKAAQKKEIEVDDNPTTAVIEIDDDEEMFVPQEAAGNAANTIDFTEDSYDFLNVDFQVIDEVKGSDNDDVANEGNNSKDDWDEDREGNMDDNKDDENNENVGEGYDENDEENEFQNMGDVNVGDVDLDDVNEDDLEDY